MTNLRHLNNAALTQAKCLLNLTGCFEQGPGWAALRDALSRDISVGSLFLVRDFLQGQVPGGFT